MAGLGVLGVGAVGGVGGCGATGAACPSFIASRAGASPKNCTAGGGVGAVCPGFRVLTFATGAAWALFCEALDLTSSSSGGQASAGMTKAPTPITIAVKHTPRMDTLGAALCVITIVILLANRLAEPDATPSHGPRCAARELTNEVVTTRAAA